MRVATLLIPLSIATWLMHGALSVEGPAWRALTPNWEKPFMSACTDNKAICRRVEVQDDPAGFGAAKLLVLSAPPGKEELGAQLLDALITPNLRPAVKLVVRRDK